VLKLRIEGEEAITLGNVELLSYRHEYDIRNALVSREIRFRDRGGRVTSIRSRRFVSMAHVHQAAIEWTIVAEDWSGSAEVVSALDARVVNANVARYQALEGRHLDPVSPRTFGPEIIALNARTRQSRLYVAEAARTRVFGDDGPISVERRLTQMDDYIQQVVAFEIAQGSPIRVEKLVAFYTSQDRAITEPLGTNCGGNATSCSQTSLGFSCCCAFMPPTSSRFARVTRPTATPAFPPAGSTARHIAVTCSGMSFTSIHS
jgi:trehalose/maltose hydrolase-like predicted phosphorylase